MPIFESDDEFSDEEGRRMQEDLNDKVFRKAVSHLFASQELEAAWDAADKSQKSFGVDGATPPASG